MKIFLRRLPLRNVVQSTQSNTAHHVPNVYSSYFAKVSDRIVVLNGKCKFLSIILQQRSCRSLVGSECVGLLDVRPEFKSQVGHQNENMKIFLRRLPLRNVVQSTQSNSANPLLNVYSSYFAKISDRIVVLNGECKFLSIILQQGSRRSLKNISSAPSCQQISGKNSESK